MEFASWLKVSVLLVILGFLARHCDGRRHVRHFKNSKLGMHRDSSGIYQIDLNVTDDNVRFWAIGDWGGIPVYPYRTFVEQNIAVYMSKMSAHLNTHFQVALGDNFYFLGIQNEYDKRFRDTFEDVFKSEHLATPWFMVLGNHDHYGNASGQIEYTKHSKKWILPDYNYTVNVRVNQGQTPLLTMIVIDTVLMCGNSGFDDSVNSVPKFKSESDRLRASLYFSSIEETLRTISTSRIPYVIVAGHFPVWSVAEHGPTQCLVDQLRPLLHKYKVTAYFAGHEHDVEHLRDTYMNATVDYVISGATNLPYNSTAHINSVPKGSLKFYWANELQYFGAVCLVEANMNNMTITYLETSGKTLYRTTIENQYLEDY